MPVFVLEESTYAGPIEDDTILNAEITAIKQKMVDFKDGAGEQPRVEFTFVVTDPASAWDGQKMWGETSTTFSDNEKCKLRNWAMEIMGVSRLDPGFQLDTDDLVKQPCRIVVGARAKKKNGVETGDIANFVKDVLRVKGNSSGTFAQDEEPF